MINYFVKTVLIWVSVIFFPHDWTEATCFWQAHPRNDTESSLHHPRGLKMSVCLICFNGLQSHKLTCSLVICTHTMHVCTQNARIVPTI